MSLTRPEAVGLLLLSMLHYLPSVRTASGLMPAAPGPGASSFVPCDACHGSGRVRGDQPCIKCRDVVRSGGRIRRPNHGCSLCLICEGRGDRRRRSGDEEFEAYSKLPLSELEREVNDAALSSAQERVRSALTATEGSGDEFDWLKAREAYRRAGSYAELEMTLGWLRDRHLLRYEALMHWLTAIDDPLWTWSELSLTRLDETIRLVAAKMPGEVRVPSWVVKRMLGPGRPLLELLPARVLAAKKERAA